MMRYRLAEVETVASDIGDHVILNKVLSEEESMAKFKEIFDEGARSGYYNNSTEVMGRDVKSSDYDWEEFKKDNL